MTSQDIVLAILGGVVGSMLCYAVERWWDRRYRWRCPEKGCNFSIKSNTKELTTRVSRDHTEKFHDRRKP